MYIFYNTLRSIVILLLSFNTRLYNSATQGHPISVIPTSTILSLSPRVLVIQSAHLFDKFSSKQQTAESDLWYHPNSLAIHR